MTDMFQSRYPAGRSTAPHYATDGHPYKVSTYNNGYAISIDRVVYHGDGTATLVPVLWARGLAADLYIDALYRRGLDAVIDLALA